MNEQPSDFELLQGFLRRSEQGAFAALVQRHLNLVYATALRKLQDQGAAQEVAQNVFAALARKAWQFASDDSLPAWLYKTTLLESKLWLRGEVRRRRREQTAAELGTTMKTPDNEPALRALVPLLDEALLSLRERDREVLLLRFYENQPLRDVGFSLGVAEDAARKRVAGALEKLARFFQRRGFKTAPVETAAAALQHTATSAPAAVASSVLAAASGLAPVGLLGLTGPLARLTSLTKLQTATLCLALAVVPVGWQWQTQRTAQARALAVQTQFQAAQTERLELQREIDRTEASSVRLRDLLAAQVALAGKRTSDAETFAAWKNHLRALLTANDYRWPDDSPFVRIPKSVVASLVPNRSVTPPGELSQPTRELLGLTPQERETLETALHSHFAALDRLVEANLYETNAPSQFASHFSIPSGASASRVWVIPPLGDEINTATTALEAALQNTLGNERWQLVQKQLDISGTDTLRRILGFDSARNPQQIAVWLSQFNGNPTVGYGWQGNNGAFTQDGAALSSFIGATVGASGPNPAAFLSDRTLPTPITSRMLDWVQQQAAALAGKETAK